MRTRDFIKWNCKGCFCSNFDSRYGCDAYNGEECDEAFCHPEYRGKSMRERIDEYVEKMNSKKKHKK